MSGSRAWMGFGEDGSLRVVGGTCRAWEVSIQVLAIKDALRKEVAR